LLLSQLNKLMKPFQFLTCVSTLALTSAAYADVTVNITGATAFRAATLASIKAKYVSSGVAFKYAHDQATAGGTVFTGATRAIFIGSFPGVSGTTTIRCCFTGSVEGIRALVPVVDPTPPTYYQSSLLNATAAAVGGTELAAQGSTGAVTAVSDIAFSDVAKASTPFSGFPLSPSAPAVGVIVFTMLTNEGSSITDVTSQQFGSLMTTGVQPLSLFTGNPANDTSVFATGRNDGSGTRSVYLAETGYGISNPVRQFVTIASSATALNTIQAVPAGGVNSPALPGQSAANASTVWGQDVDGNGGYNSGSALRTDMGKTGLAVTVLDETGADSFGNPVRADLVTFLSLNDAVTARNNGAVFCSYNGVKLNDIATTGSVLSAADKEKVTSGKYTAWSYQNMYRRSSITGGDALTVYDGIKASIPANLGSAGIALTDMKVGRSLDGGFVAP
jgi:hypothetical protein